MVKRRRLELETAPKPPEWWRPKAGSTDNVPSYMKEYLGRSLGVHSDNTRTTVNQQAKQQAQKHLRQTNLNSIKEHKSKFKVKDPYVVIDKKNNKMYYMQGDKTLETHEITRGLNVGDGYRPFNKETPYYGDLPQQTGAGIFTVAPFNHSPYLGHEPMFRLRANGQKTSMAIHSPASIDRLNRLNNGNDDDNRVSYGCISPTTGVLKRWYNDKLLNNGDSVYIIPETVGNYIYEDENGKLTTHFGGINPLTYTAKGIRHNLLYNRSK